MTRYFISVQEAVELVLQAAVLSLGGEVFMLDMGEPVNILDLAERMVRLSGHVVGTEVAITFVGPRPGEKLAESLTGADEVSRPTAHPSIVALDGFALPADRLRSAVRELEGYVARGDERSALALLAELTSPALDVRAEPAPVATGRRAGATGLAAERVG